MLFAGATLVSGGIPSPAATPGSAKKVSVVTRPEQEVWLFALRLDQRGLSPAFPGFPVKDGFLLPLGELCRLLDLAIRVDVIRGSATGFLVEEKRRFQLDVAEDFLKIEGRSIDYDKKLLEIHSDDIYVDARLLSAWLPLNLEVVKRTAVIQVTPRETLPLQARWKRELEAGWAPSETRPPVFPRAGDPYRLFEVPFVDESLRITTPSLAEVGTKHNVHLQATTYAAGDFLGLSSSLYGVLDSQSGLSELRMTMGRRDHNAGLLGPLHATEFGFGEVMDPGLDLVAQPSSGTGVLVTNFPTLGADAFDRHHFQGDLAPGWQVELYRNQALLGFQASRPDGRFEFLNVSLYFGLNDFCLVFYGPQGQRREEVIRFDVSESQTPQGAFQYRLVGNNPRIEGGRGAFEGRFGITKQVAASLALARVHFDSRFHTYTQAGLEGFWTPFSASLTAASGSLGGTAEELGVRTRIGALSLNLKRAQLQGGFSSEVFNPIYGLVQSRSSLEASALLSTTQRSGLVLDFGISQDSLVAGGLVERLYSRLSTSAYGCFLSNELVRTRANGGLSAMSTATTGDLLVSKFFRTFSLRGQADYQLSGGKKLNGFALTGETPVFPPFILRTSLTRTLSTGDTLVQLGAIKSQGRFSLGWNLSYSPRNRLMADLTFQLGLGREPRQGRIQCRAQGLATQGAVSARAFLDANANGTWDPGEKAVRDVAFQVNGANQAGRSDKEGVAFLGNLNPDLDANISVVSNSLEDPLMRPGIPGIRTTPRPGHVALVDFPLVLLGEINGTVFLKGKDGSQELAGLGLELLASSGMVVRRFRTAYDGFFTFEDIPSGEYTLRVSETEIARFGLVVPPPKKLSIAPDGTVIDGMDILVAPAPAPKGSP